MSGKKLQKAQANTSNELEQVKKTISLFKGYSHFKIKLPNMEIEAKGKNTRDKPEGVTVKFVSPIDTEDTELLKVLVIEGKADLTVKDKKGKTALDYAKELCDEKKRDEIIKLLKDNGATE